MGVQSMWWAISMRLSVCVVIWKIFISQCCKRPCCHGKDCGWMTGKARCRNCGGACLSALQQQRNGRLSLRPFQRILPTVAGRAHGLFLRSFRDTGTGTRTGAMQQTGPYLPQASRFSISKDCAPTMHSPARWVRQLDEHRAEAVRLLGKRNYRVWRPHMTASAQHSRTVLRACCQTLAACKGVGPPPLPLARRNLYR